MNAIEALKKAEASGKICGVTDNNGTKFNGQVQAVGEATVMLWDRNKGKRVVLTHDEVKSVRCGG